MFRPLELKAPSNNYHAFKHWNTILVTEPVRRLKTRLGAGFQSQHKLKNYII